MPVKVKKRDNTFEDFDEAKIARVVATAGLDEEQARKFAATITQWAGSLKKAQISSLEIRDKVLEELKKVSNNAYNLFAWYQKTKE